MRIKAGYYDWNQFGLNDSFYPDDMPPEWRLTYYANEIECAQIDLSQLNDVGDIEELFDDLHEQFDVLIRFNDVNQWPLLNELLENEDVNIKAVICSDHCFKQYSKRIDSFDVACVAEEDKQLLSFNAQCQATQIMVAGLNIVFVDEVLTLKQWRLFVDAWVAEGKQEHYFLMLNSNVFKASVVAELRMMIDMLGY